MLCTPKKRTDPEVEIEVEGSPTEKGSGAVLSPYAQKLPRPETTGNSAKDKRLMCAYRAVQRLITVVTDDWSLGQATWDDVECSLQDKRSTDSWDPTVINVSRLPKYFLSEVLVEADCSVEGQKFTQ